MAPITRSKNRKSNGADTAPEPTPLVSQKPQEEIIVEVIIRPKTPESVETYRVNVNKGFSQILQELAKELDCHRSCVKLFYKGKQISTRKPLKTYGLNTSINYVPFIIAYKEEDLEGMKPDLNSAKYPITIHTTRSMSPFVIHVSPETKVSEAKELLLEEITRFGRFFVGSPKDITLKYRGQVLPCRCRFEQIGVFRDSVLACSF